MTDSKQAAEAALDHRWDVTKGWTALWDVTKGWTALLAHPAEAAAVAAVLRPEPVNREQEAYAAGRLAGFEEGLEQRPEPAGEGLQTEPCPVCGRRPNQRMRKTLAALAAPVPPGLDVERLARALEVAGDDCGPLDLPMDEHVARHRDFAAAIAAEYERLTETGSSLPDNRTDVP